jgi:hypothetical protein
VSKIKKISAAEARRRRAAKVEADARPPAELPEKLEGLLRAFVPRAVTPGEWVRIQPVLFDIMRRSRIRGVAAFKQHLSIVTLYLAWVLRQDHPLTVSHALDHGLIEQWCHVELIGLLEDSTAATRRARLRALASDVNPGETAPPRGRSISKNAIKPPYCDADVGAIVRLARTQPSARIGQQLCAMVGLGLGAGLDSQDLRRVRTTDVDDRGPEGIGVTVAGERPRVVAVRTVYEELVREGMTGLRTGALLLGCNADRQNVTATIVANAVALGDPPHIEQTRLRSTWLTHLMCAPVPLALLLTSSGLTSARSLVELLPYAVERYGRLDATGGAS